MQSVLAQRGLCHEFSEILHQRDANKTGVLVELHVGHDDSFGQGSASGADAHRPHLQGCEIPRRAARAIDQAVPAPPAERPKAPWMDNHTMIFGAREISTAALAAADVPAPDGPLDMEREGDCPAIWVFAKTYPPPAALPRELPAFVAQAALTQWDAEGEIPEIGLDGLRLSL